MIPKRVLDNWEALGKSIQLPYYFKRAKFFKVLETLGSQEVDKEVYWDAGYGDVGVILLDFYPLFSSIDDIIVFEKRMNVWIARVLPDEALEVLFLREGTNSERIERFQKLLDNMRKVVNNGFGIADKKAVQA